MIGPLVALQLRMKKSKNSGGSRQMELRSKFDRNFAQIIGSAEDSGRYSTSARFTYPSGASSGAATTRVGTRRNPEPGVSSPVEPASGYSASLFTCHKS